MLGTLTKFITGFNLFYPKYLISFKKWMKVCKPNFFLCSRPLFSSIRSLMTTSSTPQTLVPHLDRDSFHQTIPLIALKIPAKSCTLYLKTMKDFLFQRSKMKRIYDVESEPDKRHLLLSPDKVSSIEDFILETPTSIPSEIKLFNVEHGGIPETYNFDISYDDLNVEEVLSKIIPAGQEIPSSFEQAGHVAHLNLRDESLPYKFIIGQVILDKNPTLRCVVNKLNNIETVYRTFPMELLAGEEDFNVSVRESGATFRFNFAEVYWNSRLSYEHLRLIDILSSSSPPPLPPPSSSSSSSSSSETTTIAVSSNKKRPPTHISDNNNNNNNKNNNNKNKKNKQNDREKPQLIEDGVRDGNGNDNMKINPSSPLSTSLSSLYTNQHTHREVIVADMMAGVGPFSVPLAMRGIKVYANDLNPACFKYLSSNASHNKCLSHLSTSNLDGREFFLKLLSGGILPLPNHKPSPSSPSSSSSSTYSSCLFPGLIPATTDSIDSIAKEEIKVEKTEGIQGGMRGGIRGIVPTDVILNLPHLAYEFCDVFVGVGRRIGVDFYLSHCHPIRVHCYAFSTHPTDPSGDVRDRIAGIMGCEGEDMMMMADIQEKDGEQASMASTSSSSSLLSTSTSSSTSSSTGSLPSPPPPPPSPPLLPGFPPCVGHVVRDVAPKKVMVCLSFLIPLKVALAEPREFSFSPSTCSAPSSSTSMPSNPVH